MTAEEKLKKLRAFVEWVRDEELVSQDDWDLHCKGKWQTILVQLGKMKLIEIPVMEVRRLGIDIKCLDVGKVRKYGDVYRDESGIRWNFSGAYNDDARDSIVFRFET